MKKSVLSLLLASSALMLTACGGGDGNEGGDSPNTAKVEVNNIQNPVVGTPSAYTQTDMSISTKDSVVMTYKMKGVNGTETQATALVFTPKVTPPAGGWPIVVWAHGTVGVADQCAPSRASLDADTKMMINDLLKEGYVVVAPDYEGLGEPGGKEIHPFLNVKSEAYSITDAVVAAKNWLGSQASNKWAVVGHSQGGQAALGAAEYAARAGLDYKGAVAVAPASNLKLTDSLQQMRLEQMNGNELINVGTANEPRYENNPDFNTKKFGYGATNAFVALIAAGLKSTHPTEPVYSKVFLPPLDQYSDIVVESECLGTIGFIFYGLASQYARNNTVSIDEFTAYESVNGYKSRQLNFMDDPIVQQFLNKDSQPLQTLVKTPIVIYQGGADILVLPQATNALVDQARALTTKIDYRTDPKWDHGTVFSVNVKNGKLVQDIKTMLNN